MKRMRDKSLEAALRLTDLPRPKWWGFWLRFFKTFEVLIFKLLQILDLYHAQKSIIGIPTLSSSIVTSLQAVVCNGTEEEVVGFKPRRILHRILKGLPDLEYFERIKIQVSFGDGSLKSAEASTETRGFVHLVAPWANPNKEMAKSWMRFSPVGVETLFGTIPIGDYEVISAPVFYLTPDIRHIIISDIDDTIKDTKILETTGFRQIVSGIFRGNYYTYDAIAGMAELYQSLVRQGCMIIYVTSTPYQLSPFLLKFLRSRGFPEGPVYPRWLGYGRFGHKWRTVQRILSGLTDQKVVLVGDSGEQDLQIYRRLYDAKDYKRFIEKICIRHVPGTDEIQTHSDMEFVYKEIMELEEELKHLVLK